MTDGTHIGRIALVTGASSGIGADIARSLAASGARVALAARRGSRLDALVADINATGGTAMAVTMNVTDEASVVVGYDAVEARFGLVDTIVANAGVNVAGSATVLSIADFDQIHNVNVRGVFLTVREGGRRLLAAGQSVAGRGRVVVVGSLGSNHVLQGLVAYSASKAAAAMLARGFAREWVSHGLCVNAVCPGYMPTDITADWFATDAGKRMVARMPRGRLMPVDGMMPITLNLLSDASAHVTGAVIQIDDGQMI